MKRLDEMIEERPWRIGQVVGVLILAFAISQMIIVVYDGYGMGRMIADHTLPTGINPVEIFVFQGIFSTLLIGLTYLIVRYHGRGIGDLGLSRKDMGENLGKNLGLGAGAGLVLLVVGQLADRIIASYMGESPLQKALFESAHYPEALPFLLIMGSIFAPVSEEVFFRGLAYPAFRRRFGVRAGIVVSAVFFGLAHLDPLAFLALALIGIGLGYLYEHTGSIVPCITAHLIFNGASFVMAFLGIL